MPAPAMPPHVVVLLAAHNGARWIGAQIDSILAQQGVSLQVLVSDDASTDTTRDQVLARAATDARVTLLSANGPFGSAAANFFALLA
jgi:rhamnosyltransferase